MRLRCIQVGSTSKSKTKKTKAADAMIARHYVEYISLTVVHNKLHFIIHIDERTYNQDKCQRDF
jgi:hypothetical protein